MHRAVFFLPFVVAIVSLAGDDGNASLLPEGAGKEVVAKVCTECHSVDRMRGLRIDKEAWFEKVSDMIDQGAKATGAERDVVVGYFAANFGTDSKVWVNTAPMVELKSVLGFSVTQSEAVLAYRKANGPFKEWRDLLKVPGIDAQKLEAKQDAMVF
jgi:competence ComEA-like helix-hairpin-helix protein